MLVTMRSVLLATLVRGALNPHLSSTHDDDGLREDEESLAETGFSPDAPARVASCRGFDKNGATARSWFRRNAESNGNTKFRYLSIVNAKVRVASFIEHSCKEYYSSAAFTTFLCKQCVCFCTWNCIYFRLILLSMFNSHCKMRVFTASPRKNSRIAN